MVEACWFTGDQIFSLQFYFFALIYFEPSPLGLAMEWGGAQFSCLVRPPGCLLYYTHAYCTYFTCTCFTCLLCTDFLYLLKRGGNRPSAYGPLLALP